MSVAKSLSIDPELESGKRMLVALSCSLLLHLCFVFLLSSWHFNSKEDSNLTETPKPVPIRIVTMVREVPAPKNQTIDTPQPKPQPTPAISVPKEQIVSPSNSLEEAPLTETRFRSDHDSRAKVQTIKRGEDAGNHEPKTRSDLS